MSWKGMLAAAMLVCAAGSAWAEQAPSAESETLRAMRYVFKAAHFQEKLEAMLKADPEASRVFAAFDMSMDIDPMVQEFATQLAPQLSATELAECTTFIDSTDGATYMQLSIDNPSDEASSAAFDALPAATQEKVLDFLNASCRKRIMGHLGSAEARRTRDAFVVRQTCASIEASNDKAMRDRARAKGICGG